MFSHIDFAVEKRFFHGNNSGEAKLLTVGGKRGRVTIHDVAAGAGVSISTASKALNDTGRMSEETRERVKQVAQSVGFRPNALARGLIKQRSFTIGLLTNDTYGRFTLPVMFGVSEELVDHGVSVFLCAIDDSPERARIHAEAMLDKRVDGIIASGKRVDRRLPIDLSGMPVPVVYAFTQGADNGVTLHSDDAQGARLAVECLIAAGCRRIVHITGPDSFQSVAERSEAYCQAVGGEPRVMRGVWSELWGHEAVRQLWDSGAPKPDGVFCGNDQIARGVIDALRERGVRVPDDVAVVGFDNWEIVAAQVRPPLTTVDMNLKALGREAGRLILAMSEGHEVTPGVRKLPCSLVIRQSCRGGATLA